MLKGIGAAEILIKEDYCYCFLRKKRETSLKNHFSNTPIPCNIFYFFSIKAVLIKKDIILSLFIEYTRLLCYQESDFKTEYELLLYTITEVQAMN